MNLYSLRRERRKLPLRYAVIVPASAAMLVLFPRFDQLGDLRLWFLLPLWVLLAHVLCGVAYLITGLSLARAWHLFRSTFLVYKTRSSWVHFQHAALTALLEETVFRHVLLGFLLVRLNTALAAMLVCSAAFAAVHFAFNKGARNLLVTIDLFVFSLVLSALNAATGSFYPALIIHCLRNYVLRVLLLRREG